VRNLLAQIRTRRTNQGPKGPFQVAREKIHWDRVSQLVAAAEGTSVEIPMNPAKDYYDGILHEAG
jgi:hypothetical protein